MHPSAHCKTSLKWSNISIMCPILVAKCVHECDNVLNGDLLRSDASWFSIQDSFHCWEHRPLCQWRCQWGEGDGWSKERGHELLLLNTKALSSAWGKPRPRTSLTLNQGSWNCTGITCCKDLVTVASVTWPVCFFISTITCFNHISFISGSIWTFLGLFST